MQTLSELADRIVALAAVKPGHLVMDVGAGGGLVSRAATAGRARVVCLDIDHEQLRTAPGMRVRADALRMPFADARFDAAVTRSCLVWVADRASAVEEVHRALRPGGVFAGAESLSGELSLVCDDPGLNRIWETFVEAFAQLGEAALTRDALEGHLQGAGFGPIDIEVIEEIEPDPYELFMHTRPPGGASLAEYLVAGGLPIAMVEGFADGLRNKGGTFVSRQALFRCVKPGHASIIA